MKKGKGLNFEEKRKRMLDIFKDDASFFHFKDIEKLGVKKGITFQTIKEVLDSLLGDNLVETDKVGSSSFYWALPSKIFQVKVNTLEKNKNLVISLEAENNNLKEKIKESKILRKETNERAIKIEEMEDFQKKIEDNKKKLDTYKKNDPVRYHAYINDTKQYIALNELWKDNLCSVEQWLRNKSPDARLIDMFPDIEILKTLQDS